MMQCKTFGNGCNSRINHCHSQVSKHTENLGIKGQFLLNFLYRSFILNKDFYKEIIFISYKVHAFSQFFLKKNKEENKQ